MILLTTGIKMPNTDGAIMTDMTLMTAKIKGITPEDLMPENETNAGNGKKGKKNKSEKNTNRRGNIMNDNGH